MDFEKYIVNVPDFPIEGIQFKDITPLICDGEAYKEAVSKLADFAKDLDAQLIVAPEARGFLFACPVANKLNLGFAPIRKPGKLPRKAQTIEYSLEYGTNILAVHEDAIKKGQRVVIIDDLLATGGTVKATADLITSLGGIVAGCGFIIELDDLKGRELFKDIPVFSLIHY